MKQIILAVFLLSFFLSCERNEYASSLDDKLYYIAKMEQVDSVMTKSYGETYVNSSNKLKIRVLWHNDDRLSIFQNNTFNSEYKFAGETGASSGRFIATDFFGTDEDGTVTDLDGSTYALYPFYESTEINSTDKTISIDIPNVQKYEKNSFGRGSNLSIAVTANESDNVLFFKNVCSWFAFYVYGNAVIRSIELVGCNGEKLAGPAKITASYGNNPTIEMLSNEAVNLTLDCGANGVTIGNTKETATEFWFTFPPTTFVNGFIVKVTDVNGITRIIDLKNKNLAFARNSFKRYTSAPLEFNVSKEEINAISQEKEKQSLMALYNSMGGDSWVNNNNWCSESPVGEWYGVSVDEEGFVVGLDLSGNNLSGEIPEQIGDFSRLVNLDLGMVSVGKENFKNSITGSLPESICRLTQLESLDLSNNQLQGVLPENLGNLSKMRNLFLDNNQFTGAIPESIWTGMSQLHLCWLNDNGFTGGLTSSIGKCISLGELRIGNNNFSSSLPAEICNLKNLVVLELVNSGVTGSIPYRIGDMKSLQCLWASGNNLSGSIPESICNLSGLLELKLGSNSLRGTIPNLGLLGNVKVISLENNMLEGPIPETIGKCANLSKLDVSNNRITGSIPSAISYCTKLQILNAYSNRLDGDLPKTLGDCTELKQLRLNDNKLRGEIPASMGKMVKLVILHLNSNQLSGEVIDFSSMESLKQLLLASNADLEGEISADVLNRLESYSIDGTKINIGSGGGLQNPETGGEDMPWE